MTRRLSLPAILTGVLAAAAALLAGHTYSLWRHLGDPVQLDLAGGAAGNVPAPVGLGEPEAPPLAAFSVVTERPLFAPARRPFQPSPPPNEAEPEAAPAEGPTPIEFSLVGIALSEGERVALVRREMDGKVFRVVEGGEVLGWVASSIGRQGAVFRRGDQEEILELNFGISPSAPIDMEPVPPAPPDLGEGGEPGSAPAPDQGG